MAGVCGSAGRGRTYPGATVLGVSALVRPAADTRFLGGLAFALSSAAAFSLAGVLAAGLLAAGWSPAAAVAIRVSVGGLALAPFVVRALRGRWHLLARHWRAVAAYGVVAVAGTQLTYFLAVERIPVATALLVEYMAPLVVGGWLWATRGQRPGVRTVGGAVLAVAGLVLVLDIGSGAPLDAVGVWWAMVAMLGAATYFVLSADADNALPPLALAGAGLVVGAVTIWLLGAVGLVRMSFAAVDVSLGGVSVPWWVALLGLGLVAAAFSYSAGIAGARRLGSRLASFVALSEVLFAALAAALLLGQGLGAWQLVGGGLVLAGLVLVKLGEPEA